jgi:hypothetical protein
MPNLEEAFTGILVKTMSLQIRYDFAVKFIINLKENSFQTHTKSDLKIPNLE